MSVTRIASRYSKSLLQLSVESGSLDKVYQDMADIRKAVHENRDFQNLLNSPVVPSDKKKSILGQILHNQQEITRNFVLYLVDKKREKYLENICASFVQQYHSIKGIAEATVTSAFELDQQTIDSVKRYLSSTFSKENILIENVIDRTIIGGMIIQYEDRRLDMSVRKELQEIKKQLIYN